MFYFIKQCTAIVRSKLPNASLALVEINLSVISSNQTIECFHQRNKKFLKQVQSFFLNSPVIVGGVSE